MKIDEFLQTIKEIYEPYNGTLLGFSGGVDSTVLFHLLSKVREIRENFKFEVLFVNHNMPTNEVYGSKAKEWTQNLCEKYKVPYHFKVIPTESYASSLSKEEIGRSFRYKALKEISTREGLDTISMAHHQDDLLETALMRLFSGVSPQSLCGMKMVEGNKVRPLLSYTKNNLIILAKESGWEYLEDPSNALPIYKRNALRHKILPIIKKEYPVYEEKIIQFLTLLEEQNREWETHLPFWSIKNKNTKEILRKTLEECSMSLVRESIKRSIVSLDKEHYLTTKQLHYLSHYILKNKDIYEGEKVLYCKKNIRLMKKKKIYVCEILDGKNFSKEDK